MELKELNRITNKMANAPYQVIEGIERILDVVEVRRTKGLYKVIKSIEYQYNEDIKGTAEEWVKKTLNDLKYQERCILTDSTIEILTDTFCNSKEFMELLIEKCKQQQEIEEFYEHF